MFSEVDKVLLTIFQFYYGSINSKRIFTRCNEFSHFNSTMVQLIAIKSGIKRLNLGRFQFYYGSINRLKDKAYQCAIAQFQFYYGSINRIRQEKGG